MNFMLKDPQERERRSYSPLTDKNSKVWGDRQVCLKLYSEKMAEPWTDIRGAIFLLYRIMYSSWQTGN